MKVNTIVLPFRHWKTIDGPLTELVCEGARRILAEVLKTEADAFIVNFVSETLPDGRQRVIRHGHGLERSIQRGFGALNVRRAQECDQATDLPSSEKVSFILNILPKKAPRQRSLDACRCSNCAAFPPVISRRC